MTTFRHLAFVGLTSFALGADVEPLAVKGLHNAFRVTPQIISGSQPEGDEAFAALEKMGVKTIISVDGAKPDTIAARKHGLRYIHLPIGYDGVSAARVPELASAAATAGDGLIYVHCHHGQHRGPAAVAVICEATANWSPQDADAWLRKAGTAEEYSGLYRAVREFQPVTKEQLAKVGVLPEVAKTPALVEAMVEIDDRFDALNASQRAGWKADAANQATLLWEHLRELARTEDAAKHPADYREKLTQSTQAADALRKALRTPSPIAADAAMKQVSENCAACHRGHRNEKKTP